MIGTLNQQIGSRLRYVREEAGYTAEQMAEMLEITVPHYKKIERGAYELKTEKLAILVREMGADPMFLLTGENKTRLGAVSYDSTGGPELRVMQDLFRYCRSVSEETPEIRVGQV